MWPNPQETADLFNLVKKFEEKLHFLRSIAALNKVEFWPDME